MYFSKHWPKLWLSKETNKIIWEDFFSIRTFKQGLDCLILQLLLLPVSYNEWSFLREHALVVDVAFQLERDELLDEFVEVEAAGTLENKIENIFIAGVAPQSTSTLGCFVNRPFRQP